MRFRCFAALLVLAPLDRCGAGERTGESSPPPTIERIDARLALRLLDSVALEGSDATLAGLSGYDLDPAGALAVGDSFAGTVRVYTPGGQLRFTLGRKGSGVGEFTDPRFPRFRGDGTLHVADAADARVTVFGSDGVLRRSVQLRPLTSLSGFVPLDDGRYLVTSDDPDGYVLFLFDSAGEMLDRFLPIREARATGRGPNWPSGIRPQFWLAQRGDSAFVVSTLSDSLWVIRLLDRGVGAVAIAEMPEVAADIAAGPAGLVVNFIDWTQAGHQLGTAIVLTPGGHWIALEHAPWLMHSGPDAFAALAHTTDGTGRLMLRRFRLTVR